VIKRAINTLSLVQALRRLAFAAAPCWIAFNLTTWKHSLSRFSKRILWLYNFRLFSLPFTGTFLFSVTVLVRYRALVVFRFRSFWLLYSLMISNIRYSFCAFLEYFPLRGCHPLRHLVPENLKFIFKKLRTKHISDYITIVDSLWSVSRSIDFTNDISIDFSSCR